MLTLRFSAEDLARLRFAWSPLHEAVMSVLTLKDPGRHALHLGWAREVRPRLDAAGWPELLSALIPIPAVYVADFLTPVPEDSGGDLAAELAALRSTTSDAVRADLDRIAGPLPEPVQELYRDPASGLARLADEIEAYWAIALEPHWSRMERLLEGEVLYRARMVARGGAAALFQDLHRQVGWEKGILRVAHAGFHRDRVLEGGRGLVLVPSVFVWPGVFSQSGPGMQPGLVYPARGVGTLWERSARPAPESLAGVLGSSRAMLLMELGAPVSTTELAERTGMAAPTVSHHLTALRAAGLAASHRTGRMVLYLRTPLAEALVSGRSWGA